MLPITFASIVIGLQNQTKWMNFVVAVMGEPARGVSHAYAGPLVWATYAFKAIPAGQVLRLVMQGYG